MGLGIFMGYLEMRTICRLKYTEGSSLGEVLHGQVRASIPGRLLG